MASPSMLVQRMRLSLRGQIRNIINFALFTVTNNDFISEEELETFAYLINDLKDLEVGFEERSETMITFARVRE
jgi:hypothetical protein